MHAADPSREHPCYRIYLHTRSTTITIRREPTTQRLNPCPACGNNAEQLLERRSVGMEEPCKGRPSGIYVEPEWKRKNRNPRLKVDRQRSRFLTEREIMPTYIL